MPKLLLQFGGLISDASQGPGQSGDHTLGQCRGLLSVSALVFANTKPETPAFLRSSHPMCSGFQVSSKNLSPMQIIQCIFFPFFIVIDLVFNYLETHQVELTCLG